VPSLEDRFVRIQEKENLPFPVKIGYFFIRHRDYTPLPLLFLILLYPQGGVLSFLSGLLLILFGEGIRIWSAGTIGEISRTRDMKVGELVVWGPYSVVRNPLYLGNFFIGSGFVGGYTGWNPVWFFLFFFFFSLQYGFIVRYEEWLLQKEFPLSYPSYFKEVPRFFPRWKLFRGGGFSLKRGFKSERWTLLAVLFSIFALWWSWQRVDLFQILQIL
jgi:protein-S-isoprenylcysteine O-methyltransferase Ste14